MGDKFMIKCGSMGEYETGCGKNGQESLETQQGRNENILNSNHKGRERRRDSRDIKTRG